MAQESFDGVVAHLGVGADLHIGDGLDVQRCSAVGIGVVHFHHNRQQGHIDPPGRFKNRFHKGPAAIGHNAVSLNALLSLIRV